MSIMYHMRQHMQGVMGFLIFNTLLQINQGIFQCKNFENPLGYDRIMAMSSHLLGTPCILYTQTR